MSCITEDILKLSLIAKECVSRLGYTIVLKENRGYDTVYLFEKLKYLLHIKSLIENYNHCCDKKVKNGIISFCNCKILLSKNNSLFLDNSLTDECEEFILDEKCCIELENLELKLKFICKNC